MPDGYAGVLTNMLIKRVRYTFNRGGYYYFTRRVPADLQQHYLCPRIVQGLNTKCSCNAKTRALVAAAKLDEYWSHLRMTDPKLMGQHMLRSAPTVKVDSNASAGCSFSLFSVSAIANACTNSNESAVANIVFAIVFIFTLPKCR